MQRGVLAALIPFIVMPGLVPGIHVFVAAAFLFVDGRDKPGHDGLFSRSRLKRVVTCFFAVAVGSGSGGSGRSG
jgi:hypothetical protein